MKQKEQDIRVGILNSLLCTPHRKLEEIYLQHQEMIEKDPRFYPHLAAWYFEHGEVRDHKEMFVICLVMSSGRGHRGAGLALLRTLPPHQVARLVSFIRGAHVKRPADKPDRGAARGRRGQRAAAPRKAAAEKRGLFSSPPRALRTEIARYLREREAMPEQFDNAVLHARKDIKQLYAVFHVKPGPRAQAILFDNKPPADSKLFLLKQVAAEKDPVAQAKLIVKHRIPYRVASTVIRGMQPPVIAALIAAMTPQELINNMASLKRRGALESPKLKQLIDAKLERAQKDGRVQAYKAKQAVKAADLGDELAQKLDRVTEARVKAKGRIKRATALLVDKSASMERAIEIGRRVGAMISAVMDAPLHVYAFDAVALPIEVPARADLAAWEETFEGIRAAGNTSCGVALEQMRKREQSVEQIIVITDEEENTNPMFARAYKAYAAQHGEPHVIFVRTPGATRQVEQACDREGISYDAYDFGGDYYALPNLIPLLVQPSRIDLVMAIMDTPVPQREEAQTPAGRKRA